MAYDVYSQFDLEKHKQTYVNYREGEYPDSLQHLSPEQKNVYLNGEWGQAEEEKYMADKLHELSEHIVSLLKTTGPILPRQFYYPGCLVSEEAELYKDQDWYINGHDGSQYYHGVQTKWPCTTMDTTRLNARIATMDLPDYLRKVSPKRNNLYLLGLLYRSRYSVFVGRRGFGRTLFDRFMSFRGPEIFERRYVGQWYYRTEEGENHG